MKRQLEQTFLNYFLNGGMSQKILHFFGCKKDFLQLRMVTFKPFEADEIIKT